MKKRAKGLQKWSEKNEAKEEEKKKKNTWFDHKRQTLISI